jgi:putative FmdB family regulatory protein
MPTYEYKCEACGHAFERFQSITSPAVRKCPKCGKNQVRRLIGMGAGLIFKGSGFYITDYRDAGYKDKAKADSGPPSAPADTKTADTKTGDTKTAETKAGDSKPADTKASAQPAAKADAPAPAAAKTEAPKAEPKSASSHARKSRSR